MHYEIKSAHGEVLTPKQRASTLSFDPPTVAGVCLRRGVTVVLSEDDLEHYEAQLKKLFDDEFITITPRPDTEEEAKQLANANGMVPVTPKVPENQPPQNPPKRDDEKLLEDAKKAIAESGTPVPTIEQIAAQVAADNAAKPVDAPPVDVKTAVETAQSGETVSVPAGEHVVEDTIQVPEGVAVKGDAPKKKGKGK